MFRLPVPPEKLLRPAARALCRVPAPIQQPCITGLLNLALKQPLNEGELDFLSHNVIRIWIKDIGCSWYISLHNQQLDVQLQGQEQACISGDLSSFLALASQQVDPDTLFFQRKLCISGDTELGLYVKNLLDSLELESLPALFARPLQYYARLFDSEEASHA